MSNKEASIRTNIIDYIAVLFIVISTGTAYFYLYHAGITLFLLLSSACLIFYINKAKFINNLFTYTYFILLIINYIFYGSNMIFIGDIIFLFATLFIANSLSFDLYRRIFLNIVIGLCVVGIIMYILFQIQVINPSLYGEDKEGTHGHYIYVFHTFGGGQWGLFRGHAGIFWEPAIYQLVINTCILYNLDLFNSNSNIKWRKIKIVILIFTVFLTKSTTGYLVTALIVLGYIFYKSKNSILFKLLLIISLITFGIFVTFSPVIYEKFDPSNPSLLVRSNDIIALFNAIWERPLIGIGVFSELFEKASYKFSMTGSLSPGFLLQTVQFGVLWIISYYYSALIELKRRNIEIPKFMYLIILTFLGLCEPLAFSPIILLYVLPFKKYS